jgi:hypothetical protein
METSGIFKVSSTPCLSTERGGTTKYTWFNVQDHLQCLLPEGDHTIESGEVEVVFYELLADFAKVFMTWK